MTVRELVETLIHNYDLDDEVMYDISNTKDNMEGSMYVSLGYIDVIEERDGYIMLSEALGRR